MEIQDATIEFAGSRFRAFRCPVCGGVDARLESLKVHVRRHEIVGDIMAGRAWINVTHNGKVHKMEPRKTCKIRGCGEPITGRGWCRRHYQKWYDSRN